MARGHYRPKRCRYCGRGVNDGISVSFRGLCTDDAHARFDANTDQIRARSGPFYERWARRSLMAAQRALVAIDNERA